MSRLAEQILQHELETYLHQLGYQGYILIHLQHLYRLLGKGNRAAGTWVALIEAYEAIGGKRGDLHIAELHHGMLLISLHSTEPVKRWAGL